MDKSYEELDSVPNLPLDESVGSSISTNLENEYDDLLRSMFPIDPSTCGFKSNFIKQDEQNQQETEISNSNKEAVKIECFDIKEQIQDDFVDDDAKRNSNSSLNKLTILTSLIKMSDEVCMDEEDETKFLNELESILLCNTKQPHEQFNETNFSFDEKTCQIEKKEEIQLIDRSIKNHKKKINVKKSYFSEKQKEDESNKDKKRIEMSSVSIPCSNSSLTSSSNSTSSSSSTLATSPYSTTSPSMNSASINNLDSDANPRKHSPIPASPPSNFELDTSSLDPTINNFQTNYIHRLSNQNGYENDISNLLFERINHVDLNNNPNRQPTEATTTTAAATTQENSNQTGTSFVGNAPKNVKISSCLDKWYKELKGHVLSEFEKSRLQILQEQQKKLIDEKEKQAIEISKLKRELDVVRESLKVCERNTLRKDEAIENLNKALEKQREKTELQRCMMQWKIKNLENAKESFTTKLADKFYHQRTKLKSFVVWHTFLLNKHKQKFEKACKKKAEEVCFDLATTYEKKIRKLEEELESKGSQIEKYKHEMTKHEEQMKKALMRGVCALNLEAMSIFNECDETDQKNETNTISIAEAKPNNDAITQRILHNTNEFNVKENNSSEELARKVKEYCQLSLNSANFSKESVEKKKHTQMLRNYQSKSSLNFQQQNEEQEKREIQREEQKWQGANEENEKKLLMAKQNQKDYDELFKHEITTKNMASLRSTRTKSKVNSLPPQAPAGKIKSTIQPFKSIIIEKHTSANKDLIRPSPQVASNSSEQDTTHKQIVSNKQQNEKLTKEYLKSKFETTKR